MFDMKKLGFSDMSHTTEYYKCELTKGRISGRDKFIKNDLDIEVKRFFKLVTKFKGKGFEKNSYPIQYH